jgi:hypothetical protein
MAAEANIGSIQIESNNEKEGVLVGALFCLGQVINTWIVALPLAGLSSRCKQRGLDTNSHSHCDPR